MELLNHKIFFIEEFFGSKIYNSQDQEEHFFDKEATTNIKKEKFIDLWEKSKSMVELCGNPLCKNCLDYKKCRGGCRVRALWEYGDINAVDPLCPLRKNMIH